MEHKVDIAIIGQTDNVYLFNAIGLKTYVSQTPQEAERVIYQLATQKCRIIYVDEPLYEVIPETIERYQNVAFPIILPLPIGEKSKQLGKKKIRENVEKAIGINIF